MAVVVVLVGAQGAQAATYTRAKSCTTAYIIQPDPRNPQSGTWTAKFTYNSAGTTLSTPVSVVLSKSSPTKVTWTIDEVSSGSVARSWSYTTAASTPSKAFTLSLPSPAQVLRTRSYMRVKANVSGFLDCTFVVSID